MGGEAEQVMVYLSDWGGLLLHLPPQQSLRRFLGDHTVIFDIVGWKDECRSQLTMYVIIFVIGYNGYWINKLNFVDKKGQSHKNSIKDRELRHGNFIGSRIFMGKLRYREKDTTTKWSIGVCGDTEFITWCWERKNKQIPCHHNVSHDIFKGMGYAVWISFFLSSLRHCLGMTYEYCVMEIVKLKLNWFVIFKRVNLYMKFPVIRTYLRLSFILDPSAWHYQASVLKIYNFLYPFNCFPPSIAH